MGPGISRQAVLLAAAFAWGVSHATATRLLAGYCGPGLLLSSAVSMVVGLALAAGLVMGARVRRPGVGATGALFAAAGVWLVAVPWVREPAMRAFGPLGIAAAVRAGTTGFFALPMILSGAGAARCCRDSSNRGDRGVLNATALAVVVAVLSANVAIFAIVPAIGAARTTAAAGLALVMAAAICWMTAGRPAGILATGLGLTGAIVGVARTPVARAAPALGLLEIRNPGPSELRVFERDDARYLLQDGTIVAVSDAKTQAPLGRATVALDLVRNLFDSPGRALVVGMRDGALARRLADEQWKVQVVDADARFQELAQTYFGWTPTGTAHAGFLPGEAAFTAGPPREYIRHAAGTWDVLVLDAFAAAPLPAHLLTREFFATAAARLSSQGVLALALETRAWDDPLVAATGATLKTVFSNVTVLPTSEPPNTLGTLVFLAAARPLDFPDERLANPREALGDNYQHWVLVQQNHAWQNRFDPTERPGTVCTDDRNPAEIWLDRIDRHSRREVHDFFGPYARIW